MLNRWISANRTLIPVRCRVIKDMEHFDGAWTVRSHSVQFGRALMARLLQMWESE